MVALSACDVDCWLFKQLTGRQMDKTLDSIFRLYRDGSEAQKRNLEQARAYLENSHAILQIMEDIADRLASSWTTHALLATVIKDAHDQLGLLLSGRRTQEDIDLAWLTLSVGKITSEMFRHDLSSSSTHPEAKELNRHVRTLLSNATQVERLMQRLVATEPPAATNPFFVVINPGSGGEGWPRTSRQEDFLQFAVTEDYRNRVQDFLARALVEPSPEPAAEGGRSRFNAVTRGRQRAPVSRQGRSRSRQGQSRSNSTSGRSTSPSGLVFGISYEELQALAEMTGGLLGDSSYLSSRPDGE